MRERPVAEQHKMAMYSAMCALSESGPASLQDIMSRTGLVEIRAKKALEDLVKAGQAFKAGPMYYAKRTIPAT